MNIVCGETRCITLKKRAHFVKVQGTETKFITPRVIICALPLGTLDIPATPSTFYIGLTVTKNVGNAVVRNHVKRRLRQLLPPALAQTGNPHAAYIIIARKAAKDADFLSLATDIQRGVKFLCSKYSF